jgi:glycosyltransferase involved in cell wall biosynthesis
MSVSKLSEQLVKAGCPLNVYTTSANGPHELQVALSEPIIVDGVLVTYFKRLTKDHSHFSPALLKKIWKTANTFDIVHIHAWWNLVSVFSCLVALFKGKHVVVSPRGTLSGYSFNNKSTFIKWMFHKTLGIFLLNKCYLHATSENEQTALSNLVKPLKIFNIPNFIQLPDYQEIAERVSTDYIKLLFFSRIEEKKGLDILIRALSKVKSPFKLTIVGDGDPAYVQNLKQLALESGVSDNIIWIGFQHSNKFEIFRQHDLFVLPSYDENFGNVVIESLSTGTAVLISKNVGLADYVVDNNFGWVCNLDELSFSNFIGEVAADTAKLVEIRNKAPKKIRADFNEEKLTNEYLDMYRQIISP